MRAARDIARADHETHSFFVRIHRRDIHTDEWVITVVHIPTNAQRSTTRIGDVVAFMEEYLGPLPTDE